MIRSLGGPGVSCSATRVRRLEAGELSGDERARTEAHVAECARCQAVRGELAAERAEVARALPLEALAAGVAERLARPAPRRRLAPVIGVALAAGLAAAFLPAVSRLAGERGGSRIKGGAEVTLYARDGAEARPLAPADPVPPGALRVALAPGGRRHAAVVLLDADGAAVLFAGPVPRGGVLPGAFEWTGREGTIVAVLDDAPVDGAALARRVAERGVAAAAPGGAAEVAVRPLRRGAP